MNFFPLIWHLFADDGKNGIFLKERFIFYYDHWCVDKKGEKKKNVFRKNIVM